MDERIVRYGSARAWVRDGQHVPQIVAAEIEAQAGHAGVRMALGLRFLLASLSRELVADLPIFGERPPELFTVECPTCGVLYLADKETPKEPHDLDGLEWAASMRLADECPDHPRWLVVTP